MKPNGLPNPSPGFHGPLGHDPGTGFQPRRRLRTRARYSYATTFGVEPLSCPATQGFANPGLEFASPSGLRNLGSCRFLEGFARDSLPGVRFAFSNSFELGSAALAGRWRIKLHHGMILAKFWASRYFSSSQGSSSCRGRRLLGRFQALWLESNLGSALPLLTNFTYGGGPPSRVGQGFVSFMCGFGGVSRVRPRS